ncbi:unnamed protein product, partial [Mesorhabditis belari]|uniref:Uncharacterized protein n=1 Tax=Mesorhabditis belari TaxID=2138241 RepID=A0AAF3EWB9_9BILA
MAFFTFNGVTKKLKVAAVKPAVLSTVFKLEPDSIVITDDDEGEVHLPDGARFDPPLIDGRRYSVDGFELASGSRARIKEQQIDKLITGLISTTSDLDHCVGMLYNAPQAVVLVEALAILAAPATDPSLVSEEMPLGEFRRLKTPSSFKASLYQVASSMCNAFRTADVSMMTIKAKLADLPDDFVSTLEVTGEIHKPNLRNDDVATLLKKILKRTTDRIAEASKKCVEMAKKSSQTFHETINVIDELCQAAMVTKGTNEAALTELKKLKVDLDRRKQALQMAEQELRQQHEETKKRAKEASIYGGVMDTVKAVESQKEKKLRKELKKTTMELSGILGKLTNLDLEKVDLDDIISYLQDGIQYLGKVKENWNELTNFFDAILILVETNLKDNIDSFLFSRDPASRRCMLESALKATGYCIQVSNCAEIYTKVSRLYVMPTINGVGKQFALTNADAKAKKGDIENMLNASLRHEQLEEEQRLRQLRWENERHNENTKNCVVVQGGLAGAFAVLGALAVIFPPVGVPALFAVGGTAATGVAAGVVGIIEQAKKASEEKLNSLRENISNVGRHLDQLKKEIKNDEELVQWYRKQIHEANVKLDQANRSIIECGDMQKNINIWTDHLGAWIAFLIKITPEAGRIQGNVEGNTRWLRRSIEEFKITFSGEINILIEACAKILAIQN